MLIKTILNLFCLLNNWNKNDIVRYNIKNISGFDYRYPVNETVSYQDIYEIKKNIKLKEIIETLENDKISTLTKMNILDKYSFLLENYSLFNIKNGGLMDDYNFNLFESEVNHLA